MRMSRFTESQIIGILKEAEGGTKVADLDREHGISTATIYSWRAKYGGLEVNEAKRLRELEAENRRLKQMVADQALDIVALKDVLGKSGEPCESAGDGRSLLRATSAQRAPCLSDRRAEQIRAALPEPQGRNRGPE